jgi:F-type H+-transporting ATPase subunit gamma
VATAREIRRRIKSVKNIGQVTRAMEAVSASKMRRAQDRTLASRAYAEKAQEVLGYVAAQPTTGAHPLLVVRDPIRRVGLILLTPDRGLAGAMVSNILRRANRFIQSQAKGVQIEMITVGRKGRDFMLRYGPPLYAEFPSPPDNPRLIDVSPIARAAINAFTEGHFDQVWLGYTDFVNVMVQRPVVRQLLPVEPAQDVKLPAEFLIEPNAETVLNELLPAFVQMQVYQAVLEAQASEHSARMVAMRNATENAKGLVEDLTLRYNKARQASITSEILDIAGGAEALSKAAGD